MDPAVRFVTRDEIDRLQRFLERSYGHGRDFFLRYYPELQEIAPECSMVIEADAGIAAHVGVYPMTLRVGPSTIRCGGIGGVATAVDQRGRGLMSRLMLEATKHMRERGWSLSVLWGDRQRYQHFGYQTCGIKYNMFISRRSLQRAHVRPAASVEEVDKSSPGVIRRLEEMSATIQFGVKRRHLPLVLSRPTVRVFMGDEGYLISLKDRSGDLEVTEVFSNTGAEAELIHGALDWSFGNGANVELSAAQTEPCVRLGQVCNYWRVTPQGMFRIINWPRLAQELAPFLSTRVAGLRPFDISIGCRWEESTEWATVEWDGAELSVRPGRYAREHVELCNPRLSGQLFGGPFGDTRQLGMFGHLLPVPIHIPNIDHV
ncbi:MAG: GNAT family N-acetyltransferase [Limnochordia bacterium]